MERNYKAPRTVPGASSHSATECPFLLPTAPTFHLLFISVNRAELFAKEHQPVSELGWERVGQAWAGQVKNRPPALKRLLPAGILESWAWQGPETARPKAFEQMAVGAWSPQPPSIPACPPRSLADVLNCTPGAFLELKPVWWFPRSCSLTKTKGRATRSPRRASSGLEGKALPSCSARGAPGGSGAGSPIKAPAARGAPGGGGPLSGSDTDEQPSSVPFSSAPALPRGFDKRPLRFFPVSLTM